MTTYVMGHSYCYCYISLSTIKKLRNDIFNVKSHKTLCILVCSTFLSKILNLPLITSFIAQKFLQRNFWSNVFLPLIPHVKTRSYKFQMNRSLTESLIDSPYFLPLHTLPICMSSTFLLL